MKHNLIYYSPEACRVDVWAESILCQSEELGNTVGVVDIQENDLTGLEW